MADRRRFRCEENFVIDDRDVWAAALLMIRRYKEDAMLEAEARAEQFQEDGDMAGAET
jgi:hypothetical protein